MNGNSLDNRDENLACVPRNDVSKIVPAYRQRIRELELRLKKEIE